MGGFTTISGYSNKKESAPLGLLYCDLAINGKLKNETQNTKNSVSGIQAFLATSEQILDLEDEEFIDSLKILKVNGISLNIDLKNKMHTKLTGKIAAEDLQEIVFRKVCVYALQVRF